MKAGIAIVVAGLIFYAAGWLAQSAAPDDEGLIAVLPMPNCGHPGEKKMCEWESMAKQGSECTDDGRTWWPARISETGTMCTSADKPSRFTVLWHRYFRNDCTDISNPCRTFKEANDAVPGPPGTVRYIDSKR